MPDIVNITSFSVDKLIGTGSYGKVYLCRTYVTNKEYAAKIVEFGQDYRLRWQAENEIEILKELSNHDNIVNIYKYIREAHRSVIILEYVSEITFLQGIIHWSCFSEHDIKLVIKQLLSALYFCHSKGIVHRDVRPDNILWSHTTCLDFPHNPYPRLKLIDFNLARKIPEQNKFVYVRAQGDPKHMSPECLKEPSIVTLACDIWSLGVLLFTIFAGYPPFMDYNYNHLLLNIIEGNFLLPEKFWNHVNPYGKDFMMKMLETDYKHRWSAKELLSHNWLTNHKHERHSIWPAQQRLKEFFTYLEEVKTSDNHGKFMLTTEERKAFVPNEEMIPTTSHSYGCTNTYTCTNTSTF